MKSKLIHSIGMRLALCLGLLAGYGIAQATPACSPSYFIDSGGGLNLYSNCIPGPGGSITNANGFNWGYSSVLTDTSPPTPLSGNQSDPTFAPGFSDGAYFVQATEDGPPSFGAWGKVIVHTSTKPSCTLTAPDGTAAVSISSGGSVILTANCQYSYDAPSWFAASPVGSKIGSPITLNPDGSVSPAVSSDVYVIGTNYVGSSSSSPVTVTVTVPVTDTTPNPFTFTAQTGIATSTLTTSNAITVSGINAAAPISIPVCSGSSCAYSINSGAWQTIAGTVNNGDSVKVRQTSSASNSATTNLTLNIGGVTGTFSVTTAAPVSSGNDALCTSAGVTNTDQSFWGAGVPKTFTILANTAISFAFTGGNLVNISTLSFAGGSKVFSISTNKCDFNNTALRTAGCMISPSASTWTIPSSCTTAGQPYYLSIRNGTTASTGGSRSASNQPVIPSADSCTGTCNIDFSYH